MRLRLGRSGIYILQGYLALVALVVTGAEQELDDARGLGLFNDYIQPLLKQNCYECHSHEAKKAKGGVVLDSRDAMRTGGDIGPVVTPGDPDRSLIMEAVLYENEDLQMPPDYKLDSDDIAHLREWISLGAPDPREGPATADFGDGKFTPPSAEDLWSVQPMEQPTVPVDLKQSDWPSGNIDRFVVSKLEEAGLNPSEDASPSTLARRIHYVLTGLPPTESETLAFVTAAEEDLEAAVADRIDELLESPHFGERWGRHWLDLARYADILGLERPRPYKQAWRYRNYVINAFNSDKPYDRFVREQLAGDLLDWNAPEERAENLVATGFLGLAHVLGETRDLEQLKMDGIDEQLTVVGKTFLGIDVGCARCHDHKIDPFPTRDYYALAGIFRSTIAGPVNRGGPSELPKGLLPFVGEDAPSWLQGGEGVRLHGAMEAKEVRDEPIHIRGEVHVTGEVVPRGMPTLVSMDRVPEMPETGSGRVELADWILSPDNELSSRVIVNRIWQHVFGHGIARTSDNFGYTGDPPSHPELLDYLAIRFRETHRYSFKSIIREMMLSRTWRQRSEVREDGMEIDPESRLLWRFIPERKDAEAIIDSIQYVASQLRMESADMTAFEFESGNQFSAASLPIPKETLRLRAVYWPMFRKDTPVDMDILSIFDFPTPTAPRGTRASTRVPSQSLALLNNPVVLDAARALRNRLDEAYEDESERLDAAYMKILARKPTNWERERMRSFLDDFEQETIRTNSAIPERARKVAWNRLCHTLLVSNEFIVVN